MPPSDKKQDTLNKLISLMDNESLTKEDFVNSFEEVVKLVLQIEKKNVEAISSLEKLFSSATDKFRGDTDKPIKRISTDNDNLNKSLVGFTTLLNEMKEKVNNVKDGEPPTKQQLLEVIKPLIPKPLKGDKGKSENIQKLIDRIDELEKKLKKRLQIPTLSGGQKGGIVTGRDIIKDIDISADLDGVTKTFNIQAIYNIISVHCSSMPYALRKTIDFTYTTTTITFTDEILASSTLNTGQTVVLTVVQA